MNHVAFRSNGPLGLGLYFIFCTITRKRQFAISQQLHLTSKQEYSMLNFLLIEIALIVIYINWICIVFIACSVSITVCGVLCVVFCLIVCVICALCLIVIPLPRGKN
jgi:hypothetical protein